MPVGAVSSHMNPTSYAGSHAGSRERRGLPAYGPVDAVLGFVLFYVLVERATPTVVDVITGAVPSIAPATVGLGLALFLWFVLVVTAIDQVRRQLAAFGVGSDRDVRRAERVRPTPTGKQVAVYVALLVSGGAIAALTFEPAMETAVSLIEVVATIDVEAFSLAAFLVMALFFVSYEAATWSADRLLVGGVRALLVA